MSGLGGKRSVKVRIDASEDQGARRMADELGRQGLVVRHVLAPIGVITGDLDESLFDQIRTIPGVRAVEPEAGYEIPSDPDAPQ